MQYVAIAKLLLVILDKFLGYLDKKQLLDAGAKGQIADSLIALNKRYAIGLAIQQEERSVDGNLAELRRGGGVRREDSSSATGGTE